MVGYLGGLEHDSSGLAVIGATSLCLQGSCPNTGDLPQVLIMKLAFLLLLLCFAS